MVAVSDAIVCSSVFVMGCVFFVRLFYLYVGNELWVAFNCSFADKILRACVQGCDNSRCATFRMQALPCCVVHVFPAKFHQHWFVYQVLALAINAILTFHTLVMVYFSCLIPVVHRVLVFNQDSFDSFSITHWEYWLIVLSIALYISVSALLKSYSIPTDIVAQYFFCSSHTHVYKDVLIFACAVEIANQVLIMFSLSISIPPLQLKFYVELFFQKSFPIWVEWKQLRFM